MKKCPFCAEEIRDEAVKCRFCGGLIDKSDKPKTKWYFHTSVVIIAILCVLPFALPLVWFNPRYRAVTKWLVTIAVIVLTILTIPLCYLTGKVLLRLIEQIKALGVY